MIKVFPINKSLCDNQKKQIRNFVVNLKDKKNIYFVTETLEHYTQYKIYRTEGINVVCSSNGVKGNMRTIGIKGGYKIDNRFYD